jgi:hypothetical protein
MAGRNDTATAVARHRIAALALAESLGEETSADVYAGRRALKAAAEAAFAMYAVVPALAYMEQALQLWPPGEEVDERRHYELSRWRMAFLADSERFYRDGGAKEIVRLIERMREAADRAGEARAETLLGLVEIMRAERHPALEHLRRAVELFEELPDDATKAEAYGELARLHMVEYETAQALPVARRAREVAQALGLPDATAHAMITESMARYIGGDRGGLDELEHAVALCREQRLPALRRAAANLAVVLQEEGDLPRAAELEAESVAAIGAQVSPVISHSEEAELAWFTGDWVTLLRAAEEYLDNGDDETTEWDLQLRGRRACLRMLCGQPAGEDLERCLDTARRSGFPRLTYSAYSYGALGYAIAGDDQVAAALLDELTAVWHAAPSAVTMEWLSALAHTSALAGSPRVAESAAGVVASAPIRSRWVEAADAVVAGARANGLGDPGAAARSFTLAVERYDAIGSVSDAVLTAVWAARALRAAGDGPAAEAYEARVYTFAVRNRALRLASLLDP